MGGLPGIPTPQKPRGHQHWHGTVTGCCSSEPAHHTHPQVRRGCSAALGVPRGPLEPCIGTDCLKHRGPGGNPRKNQQGAPWWELPPAWRGWAASRGGYSHRTEAPGGTSHLGGREEKGRLRLVQGWHWPPALFCRALENVKIKGLAIPFEAQNRTLIIEIASGCRTPCYRRSR
jgi:hypothetical protein